MFHRYNHKTARIRGAVLQQLRKRCFLKHPLCVHCKAKGIYRVATQRDHIVPLCKGGKDVDANTQGLCLECHAHKTALDMGHKVTVPIGADGWPVSD